MAKFVNFLHRIILLWIIERKIQKRNKLSSKLKKQEESLLKLLEKYNRRYLY